MGMGLPTGEAPARQGVGHKTVLGMPMEAQPEAPVAAPVDPDPTIPDEPKVAAKNRTMMGIAPPEVARDFEDRLRAGGLGYGDLKKALFENYWQHFAAARARRAELAANLDFVNGVLTEGANQARVKARAVLDRARKAAGLGR